MHLNPTLAVLVALSSLGIFTSQSVLAQWPEYRVVPSRYGNAIAGFGSGDSRFMTMAPASNLAYTSGSLQEEAGGGRVVAAALLGAAIGAGVGAATYIMVACAVDKKSGRDRPLGGNKVDCEPADSDEVKIAAILGGVLGALTFVSIVSDYSARMMQGLEYSPVLGIVRVPLVSFTFPSR